MDESTQPSGQDAWESRSRTLFRDSVDKLDMRVRSRLTQARHAALDAAASDRRRWFLRTRIWTPAAGVTAAALLGAALWLGTASSNHGAAGEQPNLEDLDMVASSDGGPGDAMEMLQDDLEFYDFADKAANSGPAA